MFTILLIRNSERSIRGSQDGKVFLVKRRGETGRGRRAEVRIEYNLYARFILLSVLLHPCNKVKSKSKLLVRSACYKEFFIVFFFGMLHIQVYMEHLNVGCFYTVM